MSVSSEEINLLVQHYLQELGFEHTAFSFGCESKIPSKPIASREIPPGSLVYLVQKGIMYAQMEAAAEEAASEPETQFGHQLNLLRSNLKQSTEIAEELSSATRRIRILPQEDQTEPLEFYLSSQSSLVLQGHSRSVLGSAWCNKSDRLATYSCDGTVCIWQFIAKENGDCVVMDNPIVLEPLDPTSQAADITCLCWSPDDKKLAIGTYAGFVAIYDGENIQRIACGTSPIVSIAFTPNGEKVAAGSTDGNVTIITSPEAFETKKTENNLMDVQWASDSKLFVAAGMSIYAIDQSGESSVVYTSKYNIIQLSLNKDKIPLLGDAFGNVVLMDKEAKVAKEEKVHNGNTTAVAWADNNNMYMSCGADGSIEINSIDGKTKVTYKDGHFPIIAAAIDPKERYFVTAESTDIISLYSLTENKLLLTFASINAVNQMTWSPDGRFLSISLNNGDVSVIDFEQIC